MIEPDKAFSNSLFPAAYPDSPPPLDDINEEDFAGFESFSTQSKWLSPSDTGWAAFSKSPSMTAVSGENWASFSDMPPSDLDVVSPSYHNHNSPCFCKQLPSISTQSTVTADGHDQLKELASDHASVGNQCEVLENCVPPFPNDNSSESPQFHNFMSAGDNEILFDTGASQDKIGEAWSLTDGRICVNNLSGHLDFSSSLDGFSPVGDKNNEFSVPLDSLGNVDTDNSMTSEVKRERDHSDQHRFSSGLANTYLADDVNIQLDKEIGSTFRVNHVDNENIYDQALVDTMLSNDVSKIENQLPANKPATSVLHSHPNEDCLASDNESFLKISVNSDDGDGCYSLHKKLTIHHNDAFKNHQCIEDQPAEFDTLHVDMIPDNEFIIEPPLKQLPLMAFSSRNADSFGFAEVEKFSSCNQTNGVTFNSDAQLADAQIEFKGLGSFALPVNGGDKGFTDMTSGTEEFSNFSTAPMSDEDVAFADFSSFVDPQIIESKNSLIKRIDLGENYFVKASSHDDGLFEGSISSANGDFAEFCHHELDQNLQNVESFIGYQVDTVNDSRSLNGAMLPEIKHSDQVYGCKLSDSNFGEISDMKIQFGSSPTSHMLSKADEFGDFGPIQPLEESSSCFEGVLPLRTDADVPQKFLPVSVQRNDKRVFPANEVSSAIPSSQDKDIGFINVCRDNALNLPDDIQGSLHVSQLDRGISELKAPAQNRQVAKMYGQMLADTAVCMRVSFGNQATGKNQVRSDCQFCLKDDLKDDGGIGRSVWKQLIISGDEEDYLVVHYFTSDLFREQLKGLDFAYEAPAKKLTHRRVKSAGWSTPSSLSPSSSIGSFNELSEPPLEPLSILVPQPIFHVPSKNTLLAKSQAKKSGESRLPSISGVKKDSGSETASETASLDLDFFSSSLSLSSHTSAPSSKASNLLGTFDLFDIKISAESEAAMVPPQAFRAAADADDRNVTAPISKSVTRSSNASSVGAGMTVEAQNFLKALDDVKFMHASVLMFPSEILPDEVR